MNPFVVIIVLMHGKTFSSLLIIVRVSVHVQRNQHEKQPANYYYRGDNPHTMQTAVKITKTAKTGWEPPMAVESEKYEYRHSTTYLRWHSYRNIPCLRSTIGEIYRY